AVSALLLPAQLLRRPRQRQLSSRPSDALVSGWLKRYRAAMTRRLYARAALIGERITAATRASAHLQTLYVTPFTGGDLVAPTRAEADSKGAMIAAVERFIASSPDSPWGYFFLYQLRSSAREAFDPQPLYRG